VSLIFRNKQTALQILSDKAAEIAFQCLTTCSNFVTVGLTEYSAESAICEVCVQESRLLTPHSLSELVWDSKSEEAGASSEGIIYLGNSILCILDNS
jgi:hypothetical protein